MKTTTTTAATTSAVARGAIVWDAHASVYEQVFERSTTLWARDALVLGRLPSPRAARTPRFLDVACGTGAFAITAASMGYEVTATDFSAGMIARLQAKIASTPGDVKISTRVVDGQTLEGLADDSFDVVSSFFGACMFPDRAATWRSVLRVLQPGGRMLVTSWDANSSNLRMIQYLLQNAENKPGIDGNPPGPLALGSAMNRTLARASFREELEEYGFHDVRMYTVSHPMCFQSGEELVRGVLDNAGFMSMAGHKQVASLKRCVLDFAQLMVDSVDPFSDEATAATLATAAIATEDLPLWKQPFAMQATGHIAVATKPEGKDMSEP